MNKILLICCIVVSSCGMKIKGLDEAKADIKVETDIPESIALEPNFEKAIETCDKRYGKNTKESEDCFQDFRDYYKLNMGFDFSGLIEFCEERYNTELEIDACQDELLGIIDTAELIGAQQ